MSSGADARAEDAPAVTLTIELSVEDVVNAHFWALSRVPFFRLLAVLNALLLLASVLLALRALARGEVPPLVLALAALPLAVFFVVFPLSIRKRARAAFGALADAERRGTYTFDDQGFGWTLGRSPGRASWASVTAARETEARVFLLTPGARAHVLPKAGASPEALRRLGALIGRKAP